MNQESMLSCGAASRGPNINESPTFTAFAVAMTESLINSGKGTPGSVGDGESFGAGFVLGDESLSSTPVELWTKKDQEEKMHLAEVAFFASNAKKYNLRLEEPSASMRALVTGMIPKYIGIEWGPGDASGDLTAELDNEADAEAAVKLATVEKMLAKAKEKLKETGEGDDGEPGEIVASLQLCLDTLAASTSPRTPGAKGAPAQPVQTRRRAGSTPPTPKAATPESMADGAAMQAAQRRGAGVMYLLHSEFPKTCRHLTGGKPPAPVEGMSAPALADVVFYL